MPSTKGKKRRRLAREAVKLPNGQIVERYYRCDGLVKASVRDSVTAHLVDLAKELERNSPGRFDLVVSCTSPTHWFVHQLADGLSDSRHHCGHFVGKRAHFFPQDFSRFRTNKNRKALVFTDVISTGALVNSIVQTLTLRGMSVGGVIALVDTRAEGSQVPFSGVDIENQVFLVHLPVEKGSAGRLRWRIDPETLEPLEIRGEGDWLSLFSGTGALGMDGSKVADWLVKFAALRHKHYKHGSCHSELVCDVKQLFKRSEVRTYLGARLNFYLRDNGIKLIVYPNHSNAYLLVEILREICGSAHDAYGLQLALCRYVQGERSYVLPTPTPESLSTDKVMLLDDGIVSGDTMRSLIVAVLRTYPRLKQIHVVTFINEMTSPQSSFWGETGAGVGLRRRGDKLRAFLSPRLQFTCFASLPHRSYSEQDCPLCRRQQDYERYSRDETRSAAERSFYGLWARDLQPKDISHDTAEAIFKPDAPSSLKERIERSKDALKIAEFDLALTGDLQIQTLVGEACSESLSPPVRIHRLKSLLQLRGTLLSDDNYRRVWAEIIRILKDDDLSLRHRLLTLRALIWEQSCPVTMSDFCDVLDACAPRLSDPLILGGAIAYARLGATPGHKLPSWDAEELAAEVSRIQGRQGLDAKARAAFDRLRFPEMLAESPSDSLAKSVCSLRRSLSSGSDHYSADSEIDRLASHLNKVVARRPSKPQLPRRIRGAALGVVERFVDIEKAARVVLSYLGPEAVGVSWPAIDELRQGLSELRPLITIEPNPSSTWIQLSTLCDAVLQRIKSDWFDTEEGYVYRLLEPFYCDLVSAVKEAIHHGEKTYADRAGQSSVHHDLAALGRCLTDKLQVLCGSSLLNDVLNNIVTNVWKHATTKGEKVTVRWSCEMPANKTKTVTLRATDDGIIVPPGFNFFHAAGGHSRFRAQVEDYGGQYSVRPGVSGGVEVAITMYCRRINT